MACRQRGDQAAGPNWSCASTAVACGCPHRRSPACRRRRTRRRGRVCGSARFGSSGMRDFLATTGSISLPYEAAFSSPRLRNGRASLFIISQLAFQRGHGPCRVMLDRNVEPIGDGRQPVNVFGFLLQGFTDHVARSHRSRSRRPACRADALAVFSRKTLGDGLAIVPMVCRKARQRGIQRQRSHFLGICNRPETNGRSSLSAGFD